MENDETTNQTEEITTDEIVTPEITEQVAEEEPKSEPTDIFLWANQADRHKDELEIDLYMFTKGYTVYATNYAKELKNQLKVLFLYDMISQVQTGAGTGMMVRDFEAAAAEENVLERTSLERVEHAQEVIEQIAFGEEALEVFNEGDHEFKKVKGIIARFSRKDAEPFYIAKMLPQSQVLKGATAWMYLSGSFQPFAADAGLRITPDNQVLIVAGDVFAFSETKFIRLFGYDAKKFAVAVEKIAEIEKHFKLTFPEGMTFDALVRDTPSLVSKLQKVDPTIVTQDQVVEQSDEMGLGLMTDDNLGSIIIMDAKDAAKFVNLLNDDYITSDMTGMKYEIRGKKELKESSSAEE